MQIIIMKNKEIIINTLANIFLKKSAIACDTNASGKHPLVVLAGATVGTCTLCTSIGPPDPRGHHVSIY